MLMFIPSFPRWHRIPLCPFCLFKNPGVLCLHLNRSAGNENGDLPAEGAIWQINLDTHSETPQITIPQIHKINTKILGSK